MASRKVQTMIRPKRRIEQVICSDNAQNITSAGAGDITLHTAEDRHTLVRIIGRMSFQMKSNPGAGTLGAAALALQVGPQGTRIYTPVAGVANNDVVKPRQVLAHWMVSQLGTGAVATDAEQTQVIDVDIKGQRVMEENDELLLTHIASMVDGWNVSYSFTLIFKE